MAKSSYDKIRKQLLATRAESELHRECLRKALLLVDAERAVNKSAAQSREVEALQTDLHFSLQRLDVERNSLGYAVDRLFKSSYASARENAAATAAFILPDPKE